MKKLSKQKIKITCTKAGIFSSSLYGGIVYAEIDSNKDLLELHKSLKSSFDNLVETKNTEMEGDNYIPHLSIAYNIPKEIITDVKSFVDQQILPFEFELNEILLMKDFDEEKDEREVVHIQSLE